MDRMFLGVLVKSLTGAVSSGARQKLDGVPGKSILPTASQRGQIGHFDQRIARTRIALTVLSPGNGIERLDERGASSLIGTRGRINFVECCDGILDFEGLNKVIVSGAHVYKQRKDFSELTRGLPSSKA